MRHLLLGCWLLLLAFGVPIPAWAVSVTFCAEYKVDYEDADLGLNDPAAEGDYFATNSNKVARGAKIQTVRTSTGATETHYAAYTGTDAGCAGPFTLVGGAVYDVKIISVAQIGSNVIKVMDNQDENDVWISVALDDWTAPTTTSTVDIETANAHDAWNVAAAAGHALWRRSGGVDNKTFDFFTEYDTCSFGELSCDPCDNGSGSCMRGGDVHLSTEGVVRRFIIVHEMGHALGYFAAGSYSPPIEYADPDQGNCYTVSARDHEMNSKEWQSAAILEGWAHFYAAVAFNLTNETDCGFVYYKTQDYDLDPQHIVEAADPHAFSCEAGPIFTTTGVDAKDYLGDWCTGDLDDRGTEMDWLRFWWDLLTEESATVAFDDCAAIYALGVTGPLIVSDWDPDPDGSTINGDRPGWRMGTAATVLGFTTEWAAHVDNGVDR